VFYLSLAAVILFGLARMRGKLVSPEYLARLREERRLMEQLLALLEAERDDLRSSRDSTNSKLSGPAPEAENM
jgi:hypothetical protein